jgi:hypothetical protein
MSYDLRVPYFVDQKRSILGPTSRYTHNQRLPDFVYPYACSRLTTTSIHYIHPEFHRPQRQTDPSFPLFISTSTTVRFGCLSSTDVVTASVIQAFLCKRGPKYYCFISRPEFGCISTTSATARSVHLSFFRLPLAL